MTDRELLEGAAKAAGIPVQWDMQCSVTVRVGEDGRREGWWNPLGNDGDALRLMATLNINVSFRENVNGAFVVAERADIMFCPESLDGTHEWDATRRAIVRAAASISGESSSGSKP